MVKKTELQNITIAVPEIYLENLKKLKQMGLISSRSEGIRNAVGEFLKEELEKNVKLLNYNMRDHKLDFDLK
ncbi:MAG: ribbon-helix-helix domain-containing protein [Promethearchaeota archaeon]